MALRAMKSSRLSVISLPSVVSLTGIPFSKWIWISCGVAGAVIGSSVLQKLAIVFYLWAIRQSVFERLYAPSPHVGWWWLGWVLELTALVGAVSNVVVHAVWLGLGGGDWDAGGGGVVEEVVAALEALEELGHAPWGNDLDLGVDSKEGKLEADLVVTLSGAARWWLVYNPYVTHLWGNWGDIDG